MCVIILYTLHKSIYIYTHIYIYIYSYHIYIYIYIYIIIYIYILFIYIYKYDYPHPPPLAPGPWPLAIPWPSLGPPANFTSHAVQLLTASGIGAPWLDQVSSTWRPCTSGGARKWWEMLETYILYIYIYIYEIIYIYINMKYGCWCWMICGCLMMFHDNHDILIYLDIEWAASIGKSWCLVWEYEWEAMIRANCFRKHKLVVLHILSAGSSNFANYLDPEESQEWKEKRWKSLTDFAMDLTFWILLDAGRV